MSKIITQIIHISIFVFVTLDNKLTRMLFFSWFLSLFEVVLILNEFKFNQTYSFLRRTLHELWFLIPTMHARNSLKENLAHKASPFYGTPYILRISKISAISFCFMVKPIYNYHSTLYEPWRTPPQVGNPKWFRQFRSTWWSPPVGKWSWPSELSSCTWINQIQLKRNTHMNSVYRI